MYSKRIVYYMKKLITTQNNICMYNFETKDFELLVILLLHLYSKSNLEGDILNSTIWDYHFFLFLPQESKISWHLGYAGMFS